MSVVGEIGIDQLIDVVDDTHRADGVQAQMGAHQQRLGVGVADAAHADVALELMQRAFKFRAEGGVFNIVDLPDAEKGKAVMAACEIGCIGCKKCEKNCPSDAIHVVDQRAEIDPAKCTGCGLCAENCPRKCIMVEK